MKNILLTGGLGYIGSHTCITLIEKGYNIFIVDSLINSSISVFHRLEKTLSNLNSHQKGFIKFFKGDIRDKNILEKIFNYSCSINCSIDLVFHFAGLKSVIESGEKPSLYWNVNVEGTKILLDVMDCFNCKNLIYSSSATIYGESNDLIITEDCPINPINPYGKSKAAVEEILHHKYLNNKNWKIVNLRYFNPIGAYKQKLIGEDPHFESTNLFPLICKVANKESDNLIIYGNDWDTRDGTCIRDFIHIMDVANGHLAALNYIENQTRVFKSINLGTSKGTTILEFIDIFEKATEQKVNHFFDKRRPGDVGSYVASNELALKFLNWSPKYSIQEMCKDGWDWYESRKN